MPSMTGLLVFVDVMLRVPPVFVIDELIRNNFGFTGLENSNSTHNDHWILYSMVFDSNIKFDAEFSKLLTMTFVKIFLSCLGCVSAIFMFLLSLKHLLNVYIYVVFVGIVFVSYWANMFTMTTALGSHGSHHSILEDILSLNFIQIVTPATVGLVVLGNYALQFLLSLMFGFTYSYMGPRHPLLSKALPITFLAPSVLALLPLPETVLMHSPVFAALLPIGMVKFVSWYSAIAVVQTIYGAYEFSRAAIQTYGFTTLIEAHWRRLNVPRILRTFWLLRVAERAIALVMENYPADNSALVPVFFSICKSLLITGCETVTAILGMTAVVSYLCHLIGCFFQWILLTEDEDDKSIGTISAILFYILSLQTGLTSLDPEKRFVRLARNLCLLCAAVLHFIHNIVNPLLLSLSASNNPSVHRHLRALAVCGFLIVFPICLLYCLWSYQTASTWLLSVSAFSVEVIVKVMVSLSLYVLFLIDSSRSTFWEHLDDYVYYIRSFGNTVEFFFGIFLFLNGAWILVFESGGAIRAMMMCIHAYFNIWCEAKAGLNSILKRRTAVGKINTLPEATNEQLHNLDDLCAICFQEMTSAKITKCNHYFHGVCLRKWLCVQDRCPLCYEILYKE